MLEIGNFVLTFTACILAFLAWWAPRSPRSQLPRYEGEVTAGDEGKFADFLSKNDRKIIELNVFIDASANKGVINPSLSDEAIFSHTMLLRYNVQDGECISGTEYSLIPQKERHIPAVLWAHGAYYLSGHYLVEHFPGLHQGIVSGSLSAVAADRVALRGN